jgi:hypothetical protein
MASYPGVKFNLQEMTATINIAVAKVSAPIARRLALHDFENAKATVIREIKNHPISKELESPRIGSKFIIGGSYPKSLFGFFGFPNGENPVAELVNIVEQEFKINTTADLVNNQYSFPFHYLTTRELEIQTPLAWSSRSWIKAVEKGIANVANYVAKINKGRSLYGIQIKNPLKNPGDYHVTPYMTPIIKEFERALKSAKGEGAFADLASGGRYYNIRNAGGRFTS